MRDKCCYCLLVQLASDLQLHGTAALPDLPIKPLFPECVEFMCTASVRPSKHLIFYSLFSSPSSFPTSETFQWIGFSHQVVKVLLVLQLQHQPFHWDIYIDFSEYWLGLPMGGLQEGKFSPHASSVACCQTITWSCHSGSHSWMKKSSLLLKE